MTYSLRFKLLCLLVLQLSLFLPVQAQNLIGNGSFSNIGAGWTFFAPATATEAYLAETSYGGTAGANIVAEVDMECNLRQSGIAVVPGTTYWFSFRRTRRTAGGAPLPTTVNVKVYDQNGSYVDQDILSVNTGWDWQCETFQITPSGNSITVDFANVAASTLGTMIDDITLTPVQQPVTLTGASCQGGYIELNAPVFPGNPDAVYSNYIWTGPNGFTAMGPTILFNNAQPALNGTYTCTMSLNGCLTVTGTYDLVVAPLVFNITEDICDGSVYDFYGRILYTTGLYDTLIKSNNNTCDSLIVLQLNVNPIPDVTTRPEGEVSICAGDTILLRMLNSSAQHSYQWLKDGAVLPAETAAQCRAYATGNYEVAVTSNKGCMDTSGLIALTVHEPPIAKIAAVASTAICIRDTIRLSSIYEALYYRWTPASVFRNTTGDEGRYVSGIPEDIKTEVVLAAYNAAGCFTTDTVTIHAQPCCRIFLPNAFSPNGDGRNDYFKPELRPGQLIVSFQVFDRWGKVVYSDAVQYAQGWDGNYTNGPAAAGGVYHYLIQFTCEGNSNEIQKGEVTLLR